MNNKYRNKKLISVNLINSLADIAAPVKRFFSEDKDISMASQIPSDVPLKCEALLVQLSKTCTKK